MSLRQLLGTAGSLLMALCAYSVGLTALRVATWSSLPQAALFMAIAVTLVVGAYHAVAWSAPTSEFDLDVEPLCHGCCEPVDPREHFCPSCGATTGKYTAYIPYVNIWFEYGVLGRAWRDAWAEGARPGRRLALFVFVLLLSPLMIGIGLLFRLGRLGRRSGRAA